MKTSRRFYLGLLLLLVSASNVYGQSQDQDSEQQDIQEVGGSDPNLVNPQNRQGYGRNVQTQILPIKTTTSKPALSPDSMEEQSVQAVLQLGVLIGVALLCAVLFMLMVTFEVMYDAVSEKLSDLFGRKKVVEVRDAASLVGTFKRYK